MKKAIYSLAIAVVTLVAMAFTEETQIMTINMADGTAIEYPIDSIANVGFKVYQGYAYDTSWLDKVYANPEYYALNDNEWYPDIFVEDGDTFALTMPRSYLEETRVVWGEQSYWEEIEWYTKEDGCSEKIINIYEIKHITDDKYLSIFKNGVKTEFGIHFGNGHKGALKIYLLHIPSGNSVAMYNFLNWGKYNPDEYPHIPPYTTFKGFEIATNRSVNKISFTEDVSDDDWYSFNVEFRGYFQIYSGHHAYKNGQGGVRVCPYGLMEGCLGRLPIIDHRKEMPSRVQVIKLFGKIEDMGDNRDCVTPSYIHPDYDDLVKDAKLAPLAED